MLVLHRAKGVERLPAEQFAAEISLARGGQHLPQKDRLKLLGGACQLRAVGAVAGGQTATGEQWG